MLLLLFPLVRVDPGAYVHQRKMAKLHFIAYSLVTTGQLLILQIGLFDSAVFYIKFKMFFQLQILYSRAFIYNFFLCHSTVAGDLFYFGIQSLALVHTNLYSRNKAFWQAVFGVCHIKIDFNMVDELPIFYGSCPPPTSVALTV